MLCPSSSGALSSSFSLFPLYLFMMYEYLFVCDCNLVLTHVALIFLFYRYDVEVPHFSSRLSISPPLSSLLLYVGWRIPSLTLALPRL